MYATMSADPGAITLGAGGSSSYTFDTQVGQVTMTMESACGTGSCWWPTGSEMLTLEFEAPLKLNSITTDGLAYVFFGLAGNDASWTFGDFGDQDTFGIGLMVDRIVVAPAFWALSSGLTVSSIRLGDPNGVPAPIPEPETWALFLIGAAIVGYTIMRRARAAPESN